MAITFTLPLVLRAGTSIMATLGRVVLGHPGPGVPKVTGRPLAHAPASPNCLRVPPVLSSMGLGRGGVQVPDVTPGPPFLGEPIDGLPDERLGLGGGLSAVHPGKPVPEIFPVLVHQTKNLLSMPCYPLFSRFFCCFPRMTTQANGPRRPKE